MKKPTLTTMNEGKNISEMVTLVENIKKMKG
jgi:hypothetical protein